ncbi:MAG: hypothetical protein A3F13_09880 [Gammaproteobacteria bacterium RIFCSPHIGHO2_12_FULL_40_19]|nr:MAG: hypothetical protein A3F13_09880 [Gammaproteobacteria bacterium RIFCSPHIGHO2_12_FULL_40_19]
MNNAIQLPYSNHWDGQNYKKISSPQYAINMKFLNQLNFAGSESVLDIGCGNGDTSREIANMIMGGNVLGIDASKSMIKEALMTQHKDNLSFALMNVLDMEFQDEFDMVVSFFCLQWVHDKSALFRKIYQALCSNGRFRAIIPLPHPHLPILRDQLSVSDKWRPYFAGYNDPLIYVNDCEHQSYAVQSGLIIDNLQVEVEPVYFNGYGHFKAFMYEMTPHLSQLPDADLKNDYLDELLSSYLQLYPPKNGICQLSFTLLKMSAHRAP